jgi:hypothetical protein
MLIRLRLARRTRGRGSATMAPLPIWMSLGMTSTRSSRENASEAW